MEPEPEPPLADDQSELGAPQSLGERLRALLDQEPSQREVAYAELAALLASQASKPTADVDPAVAAAAVCCIRPLIAVMCRDVSHEEFIRCATMIIAAFDMDRVSPGSVGCELIRTDEPGVVSLPLMQTPQSRVGVMLGKAAEHLTTEE